MIRIELMIPERPGHRDFTGALAVAAAFAVGAIGLAAWRLTEFLAYLEAAAV